MRFVIGGSDSHKRRFVENRYGVSEILKADYDTVMTANAVYGFHDFIRKMMNDNIDINRLIDEMCAKNPDIIVISTEIGYGVVPMDSGDREWRECVGRSCCYLAEKAETVVRVVCGIGNVIK